jgi:photoactive yellow protein
VSPVLADAVAEHVRREGAQLAAASPLRERVDFSLLAGASEGHLQALPCFAVRLDDDGCVQAAGGDHALAGRWEASFLGQHYFSELEPSTNNALVRGTFEEGIETGRLDCLLSYTLTFHGPPCHVLLHLYRCPESMSNWILAMPIEDLPAD